MAEYIDKKPFLDKLLYMGYFDDNDEIKEVADSFTTTDVVERSEYEKIKFERDISIQQILNLGISISKAIEGIQEIQAKTRWTEDMQEWTCYKNILDILRRNIGE